MLNLAKFHVVIANDDEEKLPRVGNYKAPPVWLCQNELGEDLQLHDVKCVFSLISDRTIYHTTAIRCDELRPRHK